MAEKAIVRHALTVYNALLQECELEEIEGNKWSIFRGKVTKVFGSTGIGQSYYTEVFRQLEDQGCITYFQRGSKSVESVIACHHPPRAEDFTPRPKSPLTDPERYANLSEDVKALKILVGGIHIAETLRHVEQRLDTMQQSITELEAKISRNITQSDT